MIYTGLCLIAQNRADSDRYLNKKINIIKSLITHRMSTAAKGERTLDQQIEGLYKQKLLSEAEIKTLCDKVTHPTLI